jgi:hypothetical protein
MLAAACRTGGGLAKANGPIANAPKATPACRFRQSHIRPTIGNGCIIGHLQAAVLKTQRSEFTSRDLVSSKIFDRRQT